MKLSINDKIAATVIVVTQMFAMVMGNNGGVIMTQTAGILYIIYKLWIKTDNIESYLKKQADEQAEFAKVIIPTPKTTIKPTDCQIESLSKTFSSIKYSPDQTLFDHIVELSTTETTGINLMKANDAIIKALSKVEYNTNGKK